MADRDLDLIPEAKAIMTRMVRMPPKPHETMKVGAHERPAPAPRKKRPTRVRKQSGREDDVGR